MLDGSSVRLGRICFCQVACSLNFSDCPEPLGPGEDAWRMGEKGNRCLRHLETMIDIDIC